MNTIYYRVIDDCEDSYYEVETCFNISKCPDHVATDAADHYYANHDGWESDWPVTISLHETEGGQEKARMIVEIEAQPQFIARRIER